MIVSLETYFAYIAVVLIFFAHPPGPGQLLFMAHAMKAGVRNSLPVIIGNHMANVIQMFLAGFGLIGIVAASADFFVIVKWLGVMYLLWLGVVMLRGKESDQLSSQKNNSTSLIRQGFVTAVANPYAVMFFAALFPQFLNPEAALGPQIAVLGATYLVIDGLILLAMGASSSKILSLIGDHAIIRLNRVSGVLMIVAALLLAMRDVDTKTTQ